jgi:hypothetical protein
MSAHARRVARELVRRARVLAAHVTATRGDSDAWMFGGAAGQAYGDNSAAVHRLLRSSAPEWPCWWVASSTSPDRARAAAAGPVADYDSIETVARTLRAEAVFFSHGVHDVPGADATRRALRVRLGHGLTALKRTRPPALRTLAAMTRAFDLVPVSSTFELENKLAWGIPRERLIVTGVPRFDDLVARTRAAQAPTTVLYMPTWRDWVPTSAEGLRATPYFQNVTALLRSRRLERILSDSGLVLELYVHRLMHHHAHSIAAEAAGRHIRVLPTTADVQEHIARACLVVTDYSSVTWDALYVDKPVVFFTFDLDDYERARGAYLDLRTQLPGPSADTPEAVVDHIADVIARRFVLEPSARRWQRVLFPFRDTNNSARVVAAVCERLGRSPPPSIVERLR